MHQIRALRCAILLTVVTPFVLLASGCLAASTHVSAALEDPPLAGRLVNVDHHLMHIHCTGTGRPTVIMDSGLGGFSLDWVRVQPQVAKDTRVCTYDRAGYGWSKSGPLPRTSRAIARELHTLLEQADLTGPYVLVGHSFGGLNVRLFAALYPEDTAGLVLVDATNEHQFQRFEQEAGVSAAPRGHFVLSAVRPSLPVDLPAVWRPLFADLMRTPAAYRALHAELASLRRSATQVQYYPFPRDLPLVVVTRGKRVWPHTDRGDKLTALWRQMQDELATQSRHAEHLFARYSGHYVQLEQPDIVAEAVCIAIQKSRAGNPARGLPDWWLRQRCHH